MAQSSHSLGGQGECVEVADLLGVVGVRDSKYPSAGHLTFSNQTFADLLDRVKKADPT